MENFLISWVRLSGVLHFTAEHSVGYKQLCKEHCTYSMCVDLLNKIHESYGVRLGADVLIQHLPDISDIT